MLIKKVGIIGAGPGGAWLAYKLAKAGFETQLFDHRAPWEKPCAGGLGDIVWHDCPELAPLKQEGFPNRRIRIITVEDTQFESDLSRPFYTVARQRLGQFIIDMAIGAGAVFNKRKVTGIEQKAGGFELKDGGGQGSLVDFVVGADGISSHVRRMFCPRWDRRDYCYTFSMWVPRPTTLPLTLKFFPGLFGYAWIFPGSQATSLGIVSRGKQFKVEEMFGFWEKMLDSHPELADAKAHLREEAISCLIPALRFSTLRGQKVVGENWALIGDASGSAHAVSGGGIHYAFKTADLLAQALIAGAPEQYQRTWWQMAKDELAGPALWGNLFYNVRMQKMLSGYLLTSNSARDIVARLISGERPSRGEIFSSLTKMLLGE